MHGYDAWHATRDGRIQEGCPPVFGGSRHDPTVIGLTAVRILALEVPTLSGSDEDFARLAVEEAAHLVERLVQQGIVREGHRSRDDRARGSARTGVAVDADAQAVLAALPFVAAGPSPSRSSGYDRIPGSRDCSLILAAAATSEDSGRGERDSGPGPTAHPCPASRKVVCPW